MVLHLHFDSTQLWAVPLKFRGAQMYYIRLFSREIKVFHYVSQGTFMRLPIKSVIFVNQSNNKIFSINFPTLVGYVYLFHR